MTYHNRPVTVSMTTIIAIDIFVSVLWSTTHIGCRNTGTYIGGCDQIGMSTAFANLVNISLTHPSPSHVSWVWFVVRGYYTYITAELVNDTTVPGVVIWALALAESGDLG